MSKGLDLILQKIKENPSRQMLKDRYLALVSEIFDPQAKEERTLDLAEVYIADWPQEAMHIAHMVYRHNRLCMRALEVIVRCLEHLGRYGKAEIIRNEIRKINEKTHSLEILSQAEHHAFSENLSYLLAQEDGGFSKVKDNSAAIPKKPQDAMGKIADSDAASIGVPEMEDSQFASRLELPQVDTADLPPLDRVTISDLNFQKMFPDPSFNRTVRSPADIVIPPPPPSAALASQDYYPHEPDLNQEEEQQVGREALEGPSGEEEQEPYDQADLQIRPFVPQAPPSGIWQLQLQDDLRLLTPEINTIAKKSAFRADDRMHSFPEPFKAALEHWYLQHEQALKSTQVSLLWDLLQMLWGAGPHHDCAAFLRQTRMAFYHEGFWGLYLDCLLAAHYHRKALYEIRRQILQKDDLGWAKTAWLRLPEILHNLKLQPLDWSEEEGVRGLREKLAYPLSLTHLNFV